MLTLAFDTSSNKGGVALLKNETVLNRLVWDREGSHGELLTPALQRCLEQSGHSPKDLDALAIGQGPGSFTGVRIAVNAAKALAYSLDKPVYVFDSTEILAAGVPTESKPLLTLINAHKNLVFAALFDFDQGHWRRRGEIEVLDVDSLNAKISMSVLCIGDGYDEFKTQLDPRTISLLERRAGLSDDPLPEALGLLAWRERQTRKAMGWKDVQALYIRASGAEEKLRESRMKRPEG
jgi:N6-L-threonylcarbamoyladenine synthase/tRNA threonylcarbamoyladenosine biosynthesis protein TsaB